MTNYHNYYCQSKEVKSFVLHDSSHEKLILLVIYKAEWQIEKDKL